MPRLLIALLALSVSACGIPRQSVVFLSEPTQDAGTRSIPDEWNGRLVRVRDVSAPTATGGSAMHDHALAHSHSGISAPTEGVGEPLGIREATADALHTHAVESVETAPGRTGEASNVPPSYAVAGGIVERTMRRPVAGLIVGYLRLSKPADWEWCDGSNGTPDLSDRYIMLGGTPGETGSASHTHPADHSHRWATAENPDRPGYFGDPSSPADPSLTAALRVHRHSATAETLSSGETDTQPNAPPAVALKFICATEESRMLPSGMVVAYSGNRVPGGWTELSEGLGESVAGRLVKALTDSEARYELSGVRGHDHLLTSRHRFQLAAETGTAGRDRMGSGPPVPLASHMHSFEIEEVSTTSAADLMPPYVDLMFIVKN